MQAFENAKNQESLPSIKGVTSRTFWINIWLDQLTPAAPAPLAKLAPRESSQVESIGSLEKAHGELIVGIGLTIVTATGWGKQCRPAIRDDVAWLAGALRKVFPVSIKWKSPLRGVPDG